MIDRVVAATATTGTATAAARRAAMDTRMRERRTRRGTVVCEGYGSRDGAMSYVNFWRRETTVKSENILRNSS